MPQNCAILNLRRWILSFCNLDKRFLINSWIESNIQPYLESQTWIDFESSYRVLKIVISAKTCCNSYWRKNRLRWYIWNVFMFDLWKYGWILPWYFISFPLTLQCNYYSLIIQSDTNSVGARKHLNLWIRRKLFYFWRIRWSCL